MLSWFKYNCDNMRKRILLCETNKKNQSSYLSARKLQFDTNEKSEYPVQNRSALFHGCKKMQC